MDIQEAAAAKGGLNEGYAALVFRPPTTREKEIE
jgi:hypothetical protein